MLIRGKEEDSLLYYVLGLNSDFLFQIQSSARAASKVLLNFSVERICVK